MSEQTFGDSAPRLENAGVAPPGVSSFRNSVPMPVVNTQIHSVLPTLPPRPEFLTGQNYGANQYSYGMGGMGSYGMNGMGSYGMGGMGGYGGYSGGYGSGGYGSVGYGSGGYGSGGYGIGMGMNSYGIGGQNYGYGNIESRFIQLAEENSRPAFESIQSLVYAVGGVSMMLENTFFALTSSFRAILGVAENFGRLRSLFAQFWTTFGMIRSINWLFRKLAVMIGIRTEAEFKAWAEAVAATQTGFASAEQRARGSTWPVLLFFGLIAAAPYILLKMMTGVTSQAEALDAARAKQIADFARQEAFRLATARCAQGRMMRVRKMVSDPRSWNNPLRAVAQHSHQATSTQEVSFNKDQILKVAPQVLQGNLWNSGWLMASADGYTSGLVPVNYIKIIVPAEGSANYNTVPAMDNASRITVPTEGNASRNAMPTEGNASCNAMPPESNPSHMFPVSDPKSWKNPLRAVAQQNRQATSTQELSFNKDQILKVAPQVLQGNLWNSGWLMATADGSTAGLVPVNYIKIIVPAEGSANYNTVPAMDNASRITVPTEGNASRNAMPTEGNASRNAMPTEGNASCNAMPAESNPCHMLPGKASASPKPDNVH